MEENKDQQGTAGNAGLPPEFFELSQRFDKLLEEIADRKRAEASLDAKLDEMLRRIPMMGEAKPQGQLTGVNLDDTVDLHVFPHHTARREVCAAHDIGAIHEDESMAQYTWHWPERE